MSDLVVETSSGPVRGFFDRGVPNWRGVPYGHVERRFRPAVPARPAARVDATRWGPISWQVPIYAGVSWQVVFDDSVEQEDCLNLNIWSPAADGKSRPVLVWLHPGGHVYGSGSGPSMDAWVFAARHDAVVVTANYRLGPWGWLYFGAIDPAFADSANLPVLDQLLLLQWIRDNAARFGGDPGNVTLFGMSSGGSDVGTMLGVPAARGLFHKAAIYSGNAEIHVTRAEAESRAATFVSEAGSLGQSPADLAAAPNLAIRYIHRKLLTSNRVHYAPFIDGEVIPRPPLESIDDGLIADVPVLISVTAEEALMYHGFSDDMVDIMYASHGGPDQHADHDQKVEFLTEELFFQPAERVLAAVHKAGGQCWYQMFDYNPTTSYMSQNPKFTGRAVHGADTTALFIDPSGTEGTEVDRAVGAEEQAALMGLARAGRPAWAPWSPAQPAPYQVKP